MKQYNAQEEHKPFERSSAPSKGHPNKGRKEQNPYSKRKAD